MTTQDKVTKKVNRLGRGSVFSPKDFHNLGNRNSIDQALSRLVKRGKIRRLAQGVYDYPVVSKRVGNRSPDPYKVARSVASRNDARIQHSGAYAAHVLGISDQVPAGAFFLTDGPSRTIRAGKHTVTLKHASQRTMIGAGTITGNVLHALKYLGQNGIDGRVIRVLRERLNDDDKRRLELDAPNLPIWVQEVVQKIVSPE